MSTGPCNIRGIPRPNAATDLRGTALGDNSVSLTWTIPSQPSGVTIANVEVQQRRSGGAFSPPSWDTVVTLPGHATFTGVPGLAADTEYVFRIRLTTTHGLFADSRYIRVRTLTEAPAPRHFAASWPTQTSITLDWSTVETAAEYELEYRKDGETEWTRISGDFDHLPSTTDHRQAFGVAAGLDCNTRYDFRLSARGSGETRNDGRRYPSTLFGSYATTSTRTGECAQEERVTNLLVSVEPSCAILTWTPPSGDRVTGYRVERYSHTGRAVGELQRTPLETLVEEPNRVAVRYQDCSAEYRTDGAEHVYSVTALDNNPGPDEEGAFGTAYTSLLRYGTSREPEGPLNVRLTHDTQSSRGLAWDAPLTAADFQIDVTGEQATVCPAGHPSIEEYELKDAPERVEVHFAGTTCEPCPLRSRCPVKLDRRAGAYVLKADLVKVNIERRRRAEATEEWRKRYDLRAGIEGTNSELKRAHGLGRCGCEGAIGCGLPST